MSTNRNYVSMHSQVGQSAADPYGECQRLLSADLARIDAAYDQQVAIDNAWYRSEYDVCRRWFLLGGVGGAYAVKRCNDAADAEYWQRRDAQDAWRQQALLNAQRRYEDCVRLVTAAIERERLRRLGEGARSRVPGGIPMQPEYPGSAVGPVSDASVLVRPSPLTPLGALSTLPSGRPTDIVRGYYPPWGRW